MLTAIATCFGVTILFPNVFFSITLCIKVSNKQYYEFLLTLKMFTGLKYYHAKKQIIQNNIKQYDILTKIENKHYFSNFN